MDNVYLIKIRYWVEDCYDFDSVQDVVFKEKESALDFIRNAVTNEEDCTREIIKDNINYVVQYNESDFPYSDIWTDEVFIEQMWGCDGSSWFYTEEVEVR